MNKTKIFGLTMFALFTLCMAMATTAFASIEWLAGGNPITEVEGPLIVKVAGLLELTDSETSFGAMTVKCEDIQDGTVGPVSEDLIEALLNPGGELINQFGEAPELALTCEGGGKCEKAGAEAWPKNLYPSGWKTQLELMGSEPTFLDHLFAGGIGKEPGYEMRCLVSGMTQSDYCEGLTSAKMENISAEKDVLELFNPEAPISSQKGTCELGGTGAGELLDEYLIFLESGLELSISPFSELAEWLRSGAAITTSKATEITGEILLEDTETLAGPTSVVCATILVGTVGPDGEGTITEALNSAKEKIGELGGLALKCATEQTCASATEISPIEVWPGLLPWTTLLFLTEGGEYLVLVENASYELLCLVLGLNVEDKCEYKEGIGSDFPIENQVGGAAIPAGSMGLPLAACTQSGKATGLNEFVALTPIILVEGGELTVFE